MEWVDTDGCISAPQYCKYFITSVTKGIQAAVKNAIVTTAAGQFKGGNYIGDARQRRGRRSRRTTTSRARSRCRCSTQISRSRPRSSAA